MVVRYFKLCGASQRTYTHIYMYTFLSRKLMYAFINETYIRVHQCVDCIVTRALLVSQHCASQDVRFKFGRSNSHSHTSGRSGRKSNSSPSVENTICHKSLPDLHTSTRRRASLSPRASTKLPAKPSAHHQATNTTNCPDYETSSDYSDHSFKRDSVCYRR